MLEINCLKSNKLLLTRYDKQNSLYQQTSSLLQFLRYQIVHAFSCRRSVSQKKNLVIRIGCLKWLQGLRRKSWEDIFHSFQHSCLSISFALDKVTPLKCMCRNAYNSVLGNLILCTINFNFHMSTYLTELLVFR